MGYEEYEEFLDKVYEQILSETKINDNNVHTPYSPYYFSSLPNFFNSFLLCHFINHCKEVYSLNDGEIQYVWNKYYEEMRNEYISMIKI